jgi:hypothetical protein
LEPSWIDTSLDSRAVSFENPTGARGAGGQAHPTICGTGLEDYVGTPLLVRPPTGGGPTTARPPAPTQMAMATD